MSLLHTREPVFDSEQIHSDTECTPSRLLQTSLGTSSWRAVSAYGLTDRFETTYFLPRLSFYTSRAANPIVPQVLHFSFKVAMTFAIDIPLAPVCMVKTVFLSCTRPKRAYRAQAVRFLSFRPRFCKEEPYRTSFTSKGPRSRRFPRRTLYALGRLLTTSHSNKPRTAEIVHNGPKIWGSVLAGQHMHRVVDGSIREKNISS